MKKIVNVILIALLLSVSNLQFIIADEEENSIYNPEDLSDYFGTKQACTDDGTENDCKNGNEYKFYLKMYDMYYLYKNKYNITLDLPLIMAALYYNNEQLPLVFQANLSTYNRNSLKDTNQVTNLDWEYDYKNISDYQYLDADDFRYDMQILAKNMVTKKITYKCSDGTSKEVVDIEDTNYSEETLKCDDGKYEEDSISATYELDKEKYDDFLLEYIEKKYHTKGSGKDPFSSDGSSSSGSSSSVGGNSLADAMVKFALNEYETDKNVYGGAKYLASLGLPYGTAWCAAFVTYVTENASYNGQKVSDIVKVRSARVGDYTDYFMASTDSNQKFHYNSSCSYYSSYEKYIPKPGDYVFFSNSYQNCSGYTSVLPVGCHDHIGIVEKVEGDKVYTVEGNSCSYPGCLVNIHYDLNDCKIVGYGSWY